MIELRAVRRVSCAILGLMMGAMTAPAAHSQTVRGALVEEASGAPVQSAVVALLDSQGKRVRQTLTDEQGRFAVVAPAPGVYRIRADRIGFQSTTSDPVELAAGQVLEQRLVATGVPTRLGVITVSGRARCVSRPQDGEETAALWEETRKALSATALAQSEGRFRVTVERWLRDLSPSAVDVLSEQRRLEHGVTRNPFVSVPARELAARGYARMDGDDRVYFAPDAHVLLSDEFLDGHCFRVQKGSGANAGMLGLAFEPARGRKLPDIEGVLWIDEGSAELRYLEYRYTELDLGVTTDKVGGSVAFRRLPSGVWIVSRWFIRMPIITESQSEGTPLPTGQRQMRKRLAMLREEGGEVVRTAMLDGRAPSRATPDSTRVPR